ncbi:hypothetical protein [uncultured Clostridium sp.]|uniref:hypothetical protein n=1 Tax=uncultured Clostridium sp. TaxID=59620 RepID=UPI003216B780
MINIESNNTIKKYGIYKLNRPIEFKYKNSIDMTIKYGIVISNQPTRSFKDDDVITIIGYDSQIKKVIKHSMHTCMKNILSEFIGMCDEKMINECIEEVNNLFNKKDSYHNEKINGKIENEKLDRKQFLINEENRLNKEIVELYEQIKEKEKLLNNVTKKLSEYR